MLVLVSEQIFSPTFLNCVPIYNEQTVKKQTIGTNLT